MLCKTLSSFILLISLCNISAKNSANWTVGKSVVNSKKASCYHHKKCSNIKETV